jgi:hypothetical protein
MCSAAASEGHFEALRSILKWARENNCHWDEQTCADASTSGHLEILKWAFENGCPWDKNLYLNVIKKNNI